MLCEDDTFHLTESTNGGASFTQFASPPGFDPYASWASTKGSIFAAGALDPVHLLPKASPSTDTTRSGLGSASGRPA
ncbi:MAG TPA: hypothetical protein VGH28_25550 [Polyangiaceae bacterium]